MDTKNEELKPADNMEALKQEASACGPGCGCHAAGSFNRIRWIVGVVVILAAGALVARSVIKNNNAAADKAASAFAALPTVAQASAPVGAAISETKASPATASVAASTTDATPAASNTVSVQEIGALAELNAVAADTGAVFIYLAGKDEPVIKTPLAQMRGAVKTIGSQANIKIGLFRLKADSPDYIQLAAQIPLPGVLAMVKGRGMAPVSGEITEARLIQGFVAASSAGGCGPSSGGCGPRGCN